MARAAELAQSQPPAAEVRRFYGYLARFHQSISRARPDVPLSSYVKPLLSLVARTAPAALAQSAGALLGAPASWEGILLNPATPTEVFLSRLLRQAGQEALARGREVTRTSVQPICPFCRELPVSAVLRPEGDGGKRFLLCSLCLTEWEFRRILCPRCGEEDKDKLAIYTAEEFPHIRVETCESCRSYIKAIDLTRNGRAVPVVDELASIPLDLWAVEKGYTKLQPNLFGM